MPKKKVKDPLSYNLTACAQRAVHLHAQRIAKDHGADQILPIHILIGATCEKEDELIYRYQKTSPSEVYEAAKPHLERGDYHTGLILPLSDQAFELLSLAHQETNHTIRIGHLMLAVLHLGEDEPAYQALHGSGFHTPRTRMLMGTK